MGLSERRACSIVDADRKMVRYRSTRPPTPSFGPDCGISPMNRDGSVTDGCSSCCGRRGSRPASIASITSTGRKDCRCASGRQGARLSARGRRSPWRPGPTRTGRSTSSKTSSPTAGVSASSTSSTTSPRSASAPSPTCRSRVATRRTNGAASGADPDQVRDQRPRYRVHLQGAARLMQGQQARLEFHRPGRADAERLRRELQRAHA